MKELISDYLTPMVKAADALNLREDEVCGITHYQSLFHVTPQCFSRLGILLSNITAMWHTDPGEQIWVQGSVNESVVFGALSTIPKLEELGLTMMPAVSDLLATMRVEDESKQFATAEVTC